MTDPTPPINALKQAIAAAEADEHGGKVLLPLDVARALLKALEPQHRMRPSGRVSSGEGIPNDFQR